MRTRKGPISVADLASDALRPAMAKHGFATSELIARWPELVGERFARVSRPLRVTWPRQASEMVEAQGRAAATLVVQCEGAHALDLQFHAATLLERVNILYGWKAIERLSIRQGPVARARPRRGSDAFAAPPPAIAEPALAAIVDPALKAALDRLGRGVATDARRTKT